MYPYLTTGSIGRWGVITGSLSFAVKGKQVVSCEFLWYSCGEGPLSSTGQETAWTPSLNEICTIEYFIIRSSSLWPIALSLGY